MEEDYAMSADTPLADALLRLSLLTKHSFHTLPMLHGASISDCVLQEKYEALYGKNLPSIELTATGTHFDSFFFSDGVIRKAEDLAAKLYGADGTLFVTTGTTTSNQIAVHTLYENGFRVLLDKTCHMSMHVTLQTLQADVDYLRPLQQFSSSVHSYWCPDELLNRLLDAQEQGDGYQLVILNGQSYDGLLYDIPAILEYLFSNGVKTRRFLIDEAWSSANYFDEATKHCCAMNINSLREKYPDLVVVSTQSAHKTLSCLRQSSMIHFRGEPDWLQRLYISRFRTHTTSPSYSLLASLDLARAQMESHGFDLVARARGYVSYFEEMITTDPTLSMYSLEVPCPPETPFPYATHNPMKISLDISGIGMSPEQLRDRLLTLHGIYVNRFTNNSLLLNFHIGIIPQALERLLDGLREIGRRESHSVKKLTMAAGTSSNNFIIPYPPGVPIIVPGEPLDNHVLEKIDEIQDTGVSVLSV